MGGMRAYRLGRDLAPTYLIARALGDDCRLRRFEDDFFQGNEDDFFLGGGFDIV